MADANDVGFIHQCVLCGSFSVWAIDSLDPIEVSRKVSAQGSHKTLQKDVHAAELELLEDIQRRTCNVSEEGQVGSANRFTFLPCSTCIEIVEGKIFAEWLGDRQNCDKPTPLSPHMAVYFEDSMPPAYIRKAGKWCLAQGVGPKDLEVKLPFQLPAGQFKALLPPISLPLRPLCWPRKGECRGDNADEEPREKWLERQHLLQVFFVLATAPTHEAPCDTVEHTARPPVGQVLPFISDLLLTAEEEFRPVSQKRSKGAAICVPHRGYVRVPLLAVAEAISPLVESHLACQKKWAERRSFSSEYDNTPVEKASGSIVMEPKCDSNLTSFQFRSCQLLSRQAFGFWKVEILLNALSAMKAPVDLVCVRCPADVRHRAGYSPKHNRIWMCANRFWNPFEFRRVLVHELTHAFDFARAKVDTGSCVHIACTEIRAWNLSGECDLWRNSFKYFGEEMINRKQRCVRDGAVASLLENERCQDTYVAHAALEEAWPQCWRDYWPFTTKPDLDTRWRQSPMLR
ncbi:unnamed protein product [Durusdinium trenchii]|uniref:Mitochondrial inner membrane protease ATP23 n=1 Tax=Durusdinium trenchii TaxID=1381693 RepID=A0ABP0QF26_9DINO